MKLTIDEHHQHKDVYAHSLTVLQRRSTWRPAIPTRPAVGGAAARHRQAGHPAPRGRGGVSFHHHEVVGAKMVRKRLRALKYPKAMTEDIAQLCSCTCTSTATATANDRFGGAPLGDAGPLLDRLHKLVRADCTTQPAPGRAGCRRTTTTSSAGSPRSPPPKTCSACGPTWTATQSWSCSAPPPGPLVGRRGNTSGGPARSRSARPGRGRGRVAPVVGRAGRMAGPAESGSVVRHQGCARLRAGCRRSRAGGRRIPSTETSAGGSDATVTAARARCAPGDARRGCRGRPSAVRSSVMRPTLGAIVATVTSRSRRGCRRSG